MLGPRSIFIIKYSECCDFNQFQSIFTSPSQFIPLAWDTYEGQGDMLESKSEFNKGDVLKAICIEIPYK